MGLLTKAVTTIARGLGLTDQRLIQYFGGGETDAGEVITVDSSLQLDVVWACVRLIARTIATLPLNVYQTDRNGFGVLDKEHPLYRVLHTRPNYEMTAVDFWEAVVGCLLLWGNSYIAITRLGARVTALHPLRPDRVVIRREEDGSITYTYSWAGLIQEFSEEDILHIKGFSLDGYVGISPVAVARNSMGSARAAERASASIFRNGMRPSGVLKAPTYLNNTQREDAKTILESFKGAANTGGTPLLEGGWEWQQLTIPPEDAQLLQTRTFQVPQLCRWFDVPPVMIGHTEGTTSWGTGIEAIMLHFYNSCLRAHLTRIEQAVLKGLITPADEAKGVYVKFSIEELLRADSAGRAAYYSTMVQNGIMTRNEARQAEDMVKMDGGDDLTVQSNLMPIKDLGIIARMPREKEIVPGAGIMPNSQVAVAEGAAPLPQNGSSAVAPIKQ